MILTYFWPIFALSPRTYFWPTFDLFYLFGGFGPFSTSAISYNPNILSLSLSYWYLSGLMIFRIHVYIDTSPQIYFRFRFHNSEGYYFRNNIVSLRFNFCVNGTHNIFWGKRMAWGKFSLAGESHKFPSSHKNSFFSNPSSDGKTGPFEGKGKLFSRENYHSEGRSEGKFAHFSLGGKALP